MKEELQRFVRITAGLSRDSEFFVVDCSYPACTDAVRSTDEGEFLYKVVACIAPRAPWVEDVVVVLPSGEEVEFDLRPKPW